MFLWYVHDTVIIHLGLEIATGKQAHQWEWI